MKTIREERNTLTFPVFCRKACIVFIWITVFYSLVFQYMVFAVGNAMLILGLAVLFTFMLAQTGKPLDLKTIFTNESALILLFLVYMLPCGIVATPAYSPSEHISQWITCLEYMFLLVAISSIVMQSGMDSFHVLLLTIAIILVIMLFRSPVNYMDTGRYSVSEDVNPNSLGMCFTEGIWALLYFQQKKKTPIIISAVAIGILCYGIILTGSRKSLIAAIIIILFWYFFCYLHNVAKENNPWKPLILIGSFFLIIGIGLIFIRIYTGSDMASRMEELQYETSEGSRSDMYSVGLRLFLESPLIGLGFRGFEYYYGSYSHATIVEVPVSGGLIGSLIYFASYFLSIRRIVYLWRLCKDKEELADELVQVKMLMAMWGAMLFYCTCIIHPYQFDSYIVFGIIFGQTVYIEKRIREPKPQQAMQPVRIQKCKWIR